MTTLGRLGLQEVDMVFDERFIEEAKSSMKNFHHCFCSLLTEDTRVGMTFNSIPINLCCQPVQLLFNYLRAGDYKHIISLT